MGLYNIFFANSCTSTPSISYFISHELTELYYIPCIHVINMLMADKCITYWFLHLASLFIFLYVFMFICMNYAQSLTLVNTRMHDACIGVLENPLCI